MTTLNQSLVNLKKTLLYLKVDSGHTLDVMDHLMYLLAGLLMITKKIMIGLLYFLAWDI